MAHIASIDHSAASEAEHLSRWPGGARPDACARLAGLGL
jgi:nuclear transport factor 2 (NTF2) superfamily protein